MTNDQMEALGWTLIATPTDGILEGFSFPTTDTNSSNVYIGTTAPSALTTPESEWTDDEKDNHIGDVFRLQSGANIITQYIYTHANNQYTWVPMEDVTALNVLDIIGGRNLLRDEWVPYAETYKSNGLTYTREPDGWFHIQGTCTNTSATASGRLYGTTSTRDLLPMDGEYTLSVEFDGDCFLTTSSVRIQLMTGTSDGVTYGSEYMYSNTPDYAKTFTVDAGRNLWRVCLYLTAAANGTEIDGRIRLKLEKGKYTTDWQRAPEDMGNTANYYMDFQSTSGLTIGDKRNGEFTGGRTQILSDRFYVIDENDSSVAKFGETARIGRTNNKHIFMDNSWIYFMKQGPTPYARIGEAFVFGNRTFIPDFGNVYAIDPDGMYLDKSSFSIEGHRPQWGRGYIVQGSDKGMYFGLTEITQNDFSAPKTLSKQSANDEDEGIVTLAVEGDIPHTRSDDYDGFIDDFETILLPDQTKRLTCGIEIPYSEDPAAIDLMRIHAGRLEIGPGPIRAGSITADSVNTGAISSTGNVIVEDDGSYHYYDVQRTVGDVLCRSTMGVVQSSNVPFGALRFYEGSTESNYIRLYSGRTTLGKPLEIGSGGTGQTGVTETTTLANIITQTDTHKSRFEITAAYYYQFAKFVQVRLDVTTKLSSYAVGNGTDYAFGTFVSGKRPVNQMSFCEHQRGIRGYIATNGNIYVTGTSVALAANDTFNVLVTYMLP